MQHLTEERYCTEENCITLGPARYHPERSTKVGNVFNRVCDSVHKGSLSHDAIGVGNPPQFSNVPYPPTPGVSSFRLCLCQLMSASQYNCNGKVWHLLVAKQPKFTETSTPQSSDQEGPVKKEYPPSRPAGKRSLYKSLQAGLGVNDGIKVRLTVEIWLDPSHEWCPKLYP